ncbi:disulfide bond formation protein DsbB [Pseudoalteromonas citrea]|uniref:Disulfide bond formation protein B n=1 Tax=Pseudoalteromonas citrea TaxID=43655 RepID=A0A5S3XKK1_9GAMM|nr:MULTISPECIES: disulfide bond formation protein DsbB [Pseudoalteromonas]RJE73845.1 disulfide bond formation protein B [Pseudoalteromonas sp. MSK9-3]TMP40430.1 disulfide bond formation protein DsbB [Pseudoalteromonas citrea]TMP55499.1 disulfide bond formation protein DsbB [Pseudoalteromonas citrea]
MNWIANLPYSRKAWGLLALSAFIFEAVALFFQYNMGLEPCIMCIYQRTAMLGLLFAGIIGLTAPNNLLLRTSGLILWGIASIWGWLIAREHTYMQITTDPFAFTCDIVPNFPAVLPLHEWLPAFFAATGDCGNIDWEFMSMSMPNWMEVIFAFYSLTFIGVMVCHLISHKGQKS